MSEKKWFLNDGGFLTQNRREEKTKMMSNFFWRWFSLFLYLSHGVFHPVSVLFLLQIRVFGEVLSSQSLNKTQKKRNVGRVARTNVFFRSRVPGERLSFFMVAKSPETSLCAPLEGGMTPNRRKIDPTTHDDMVRMRIDFSLSFSVPLTRSTFFFFFFTLLLSSFWSTSRGHRCRLLLPFFIAHRVRQSHYLFVNISSSVSCTHGSRAFRKSICAQEKVPTSLYE